MSTTKFSLCIFLPVKPPPKISPPKLVMTHDGSTTDDLPVPQTSLDHFDELPLEAKDPSTDSPFIAFDKRPEFVERVAFGSSLPGCVSRTSQPMLLRDLPEPTRGAPSRRRKKTAFTWLSLSGRDSAHVSCGVASVSVWRPICS